jgi:hypothetical protein
MQKLNNSVLEMKEFSMTESLNTYMLFKIHLFRRTQHGLISVVPYMYATFFILPQAITRHVNTESSKQNTMKYKKRASYHVF